MWWEDYHWVRKQVRVPRYLRHVDPLHNDADFYKSEGPIIGAFMRSHKWVDNASLPSVDAGYITPLYSMKAIALRYGLSVNSANYFKKHILPDPFDIVRRRSVAAHHWSLFTIYALDVALRDLEKNGVMQFMKTREHHIEMVRRGTEFLESYYADRIETKMLENTDKFGVRWVDGSLI
jgi:hypothetical protein